MERSSKMTFRFSEHSNDQSNDQSSGQPVTDNDIQFLDKQGSQSGVEWSEWISFPKEEGKSTYVPVVVEKEKDDEQEEDKEIEQLERIIRDSGQDTKVIDIQLEPSLPDPAGHSSTTEGDWVWSSAMATSGHVSVSDQIEHSQPRSSSDDQVDEITIDHWQASHRTRTSAWKLIASIAGAIATGATFGFIALSLFTGEVRVPEVNPAIPAMGALEEQSANRAGSNDANEASKLSEEITNGATASGGTSVAVNIPARSVYVLQYGVFKQAEGAKAAAAELNELGLAGVDVQLGGEGQHRVYAAVASKREEAMLLSDAMKNKQLQMYVSSIERAELKQLAFTGDGKQIEGFIRSSDAVQDWLLTQSVTAIQATGLSSGKANAFDKAAMDKLRNEHLKWTQAGELIQKGQNVEAEKTWIKMVQAMNTAISAVNEYNKYAASSQLWNIQQSLIQYSLLEQQWLKQLQA
ncbi:SPOR domain-containing protein [Paenibacillus assamensis]|uniref:SPOR domain-containing protein n=1 Tax=Paenibacillus assamensis TaxID=311244 RepID=UPI000684B5E6|nr:SPOR domain-containing protein [Paenibacillus assamensis]